MAQIDERNDECTALLQSDHEEAQPVTVTSTGEKVASAPAIVLTVAVGVLGRELDSCQDGRRLV